ncbi:MAG: glycosyltransferase [Patescibacteria group bacterium]|jgi:glycosyltransferase involved in cell wall biosynthesis
MNQNKLKILYITQKVDLNDHVLGAIHSYLFSLAGQVEKLYIVCLFKGRVELPSNCEVFSLGKEVGNNRWQYLKNFYGFVLPLIFNKKINGIFVHMNEIYVYLLSPFRLLLKINHIGLIWWKAHAKLNGRAKFARHFVDRVLTSVSVAFNVKTNKRRVVGQGIDTDKFQPSNDVAVDSQTLKIISIGRVSPVRKYELLLKALAEVLKNQPQILIQSKVYGATIAQGDDSYLQELLALRQKLGLDKVVEFMGAVSNWQLPKLINEANFVVNPGGSNSLDKSIVEAMAVGKIVVDSNAATSEILLPSELTEAEKQLFVFAREDYLDLAKKITNIINLPIQQRQAIGLKLRDLVVKYHNVNHLSQEIVNTFNQLIN